MSERIQWELSHRCDPRGRALADRHYSRQTVGAKNFVQPGKCLVLVKPDDYLEGASAVWVSTWPYAEYVLHDWRGPHPLPSTRYVERFNKKTGTKMMQPETPGTWNNALFRNESRTLSSFLIRQAVAVTLGVWGESPPMGMVTMVWGAKVSPKATVGRCYLEAGFHHVGKTRKGDKDVFILSPEDMPKPRNPRRDSK